MRFALAALHAALAVYVLVLILASLDALDMAEAAAEIGKWIEFGLVSRTRAVHASRQNACPGWWQACCSAHVFRPALDSTSYALLSALNGLHLPGGHIRASGLFRQPNPYAGYLGLALPVAVSLTLWSWARLLRGGHCPT